jgi:hypothetical protein
MQAVRAHNTSFAWSTRFNSAGGRDIVPSLFEEKSALFVFVATGSGVGYVSGVAILCFTVQVAQAPRTAFGGYFGALKI